MKSLYLILVVVYSFKLFSIDQSKLAPQAVTNSQIDAEQNTEEGQEQKTYYYSPVGKRDPFESFSLTILKKEKMEKPSLEKYDINQLKLVGILWKNNMPKAMFETPDGNSHIVTIGAKVGKNKGFIKQITKNKVFIEERYSNVLGKIIPQISVIGLNEEDKSS